MRKGIAAALAMLAFAVPAAAAAKCPQTTLGDVEDEVMCPVCGTPLALATEAPQAQRERELVERLIADCRSKDEIKTRLVAEFGDSVLALPDDEGFDLAAWLVPGLAVLLGAAGVAVAAMRWRRRRWTAYAPEGGEGDAPGAGVREPRRPEPPSDAAAAALDTDIDRYDL